nr:Zgc:171573 protein [Danio rerio]
MNQVEHLSDRVAAVHLDRRRIREQKRQERIFSDKVRTIGVDIDALGQQVKERREKEQREANELKVYADDLLCSDGIACILEQRQKKDERQLNKDIVQFRQQFQQASSRREFDLNDPELLKKQEGQRILPGLVGEDLGQKNRLRKQQEQLYSWTTQQKEEVERAKLQRKQEENNMTKSECLWTAELSNCRKWRNKPSETYSSPPKTLTLHWLQKSHIDVYKSTAKKKRTTRQRSTTS